MLDILNIVMSYENYVVVIPDFKTAMISMNFIDHCRMMNTNQIHTSFILLLYLGYCRSSLLHAVSISVELFDISTSLTHDQYL